eukprot:COSAG05_NODE_1075_length_5956_cov_28.795629_1_plen_288_part_00
MTHKWGIPYYALHELLLESYGVARHCPHLLRPPLQYMRRAIIRSPVQGEQPADTTVLGLAHHSLHALGTCAAERPRPRAFRGSVAAAAPGDAVSESEVGQVAPGGLRMRRCCLQDGCEEEAGHRHHGRAGELPLNLSYMACVCVEPPPSRSVAGPGGASPLLGSYPPPGGGPAAVADDDLRAEGRPSEGFSHPAFTPRIPALSPHTPAAYCYAGAARLAAIAAARACLRADRLSRGHQQLNSRRAQRYWGLIDFRMGTPRLGIQVIDLEGDRNVSEARKVRLNWSIY